MIRHHLSGLLALLIALQSVTAMADAHQLHQSGTEHLEVGHPHHIVDTHTDDQHAKQTPDKPAKMLSDCHHCCHCHGHGVVILTEATPNLIVVFPGNAPGDYRANLTSGIATSVFRPPIA